MHRCFRLKAGRAASAHFTFTMSVVIYTTPRAFAALRTSAGSTAMSAPKRPAPAHKACIEATLMSASAVALLSAALSRRFLRFGASGALGGSAGPPDSVARARPPLH